MSSCNYSPEDFRRSFPLFQQPENRALVYLDNAATTQRPAAVIDAIADFYRHSNANTHRSSHRLARRATELVEETRAQAAAFLNARTSREVIFCRGATEALNLLANSLCAGLCEGDEIVLSTIEHHANLVPWQMMAQRYGLKLRYVPHIAGVPEFDRLEEVLNERTRIVSLTGGSNALGLRPDLAAIARQLRGRALHWIVDGSQLAAHEVIDVQATGCDFFVCSAHKFYGPTGVGLLYGREALLAAMPPWQGGGEMIAEVGLYHSEYAGLPHRFEAGTSSLGSLAGLNAAFAFLRQQDRSAMAAHEQSLVQRLHRELAQMPHLRLLSQPQHNLGIVAFAPVDGAPADLAHWLDERDIAVRVGNHCAQPLSRAAGVGATLRASVAGYTTWQDCEAFLHAVGEFQRVSATIPAENTAVAGWRDDDLSALRIERLAAQRSWQDRYRELMRWSQSIAPKPEIRRPGYLVRGCESEAWLAHRQVGGRHLFAVDSDSRVVKGLAALLLSQIHGRSGEEIASLDLEGVFADLGLKQHLSQSRSNGFYALLAQALRFTELKG
ncbi:cysteine desulfurase [Microbulbifer aestuariivivens]|uniref:cysteine desulfurase n=1 Tax=Microbulbifer aestuariivivens TaxID=1908308 RepID=A0ABP9WRE0_9GAMM